MPNSGEPSAMPRVGEILESAVGPLYYRDRIARFLEHKPTDAEEVELEVSPQKTREKNLPIQALMENNLARHGGWALDPDRSTLEFRYQTEDFVGSLTVEYSLGQLSTFDMELVAWLLGRWNAEHPRISFNLRECVREFGSSWSGKRGADLKDALHRISRTRFTAKVYYAKTKKQVTQHFGILDTVRIVEHRATAEGDVSEPGTVTLTLSDFMSEQLEARQFVRLDWGILRRQLQAPLARRLYFFLESQDGFHGGTFYEVTINEKLMETLGVKDKNNPRRFRAKLIAAGQEIVREDGRYLAIKIRPAARGKDYVLSVRRNAA